MIKGYPQPEKGKYKVYVNTITYNQSEYIVETFNGVAMQQTNFPFVHCVYDDCSTDGEQNVIKKWLAENCKMGNAVWYDNELAEIVEVEHNTNHNLTVVVYFFKRNLYKEPKVKRLQYKPWREVCDYEALCEGDDYWIDPLKLQRQFEVLENNPDATFVHTGFRLVDENNNKIDDASFDKLMERSKSGIAFFDLLVNMNKIMTLTFMAKRKVFQMIPPFYYDYGIFLVAARMGSCIYLPDITSSYRINPNSIIHSQSHILHAPMFRIIYEQIKAIVDNDGLTADVIYNHRMTQKVIGYIISRNIFNNDVNRMAFVRLLFTHPQWYYHALKGVFIKYFCESRFRNEVAKL